MKPETHLVRRLMLRATELGARLLRNNVAMLWAGKVERYSRRVAVFVNSGDVVIRNARPVQAGLCVGSSDLIGWTPHVVTAADVGRTVAIFTAVEAKTLRGKPSMAQISFLDAVRAAGGRAILARSTDDLELSP